ncbi:MAG: GNAT family N-acetyltransferase [Candidatus Binatia bacterium]
MNQTHNDTWFVAASTEPVGLRASVFTDWASVLTLQKEWNGLLQQSRANTIFLTWEWIAAWFDVVGLMTKPLVVVVRDAAGKLAGLAPFYLAEYQLLRAIRYRVLRVMGDYPTGAEYLDWIVRTDNEAQVAALLAETLAKTCTEWDCMWLPNVARWTGAFERVTNACQQQGLYWRSRPCEFSVVQLPKVVEDYYKDLGPRKRKHLRRESRSLAARSGAMVTRCENVATLPRFLNALFDLHYQRWQSKGEEGSFRRTPKLAEFYQRFAPHALKHRWLWLSALEDQGECKAVEIGYVYNNIYYAMQGGFDPTYDIKGTGSLLQAKVIEACISAGVSAYDFLGELTEEKRSWLAQPRYGDDILVAHRRLKSRLLFAANVWPTGRFLNPTRELPPPCIDGRA